MKILSYSPSVEAYVRSGNLGKYIDLTPDIVQCSVSRKTDAASEFSMTLQNPNWKYNGVFTPFDPIVIFATKVERRKLFTGYISTCDAFQLYQGDFKLSGVCTLYRIQQTFWDPLIYESQELLMSDAYHNGSVDNGYADLVVRLLTQVGHWPKDSIYIQDSPPQEAIDIAHEMYAANLDSSEQLKSMVDDFYDVLRTHGPVISGGSSTSTSMGGGAYDINDANMTKAQRDIVETAMSGRVPGSAGMCLAWANDVCDAAGHPFQRFPAAMDVWDNWKDTGGTDVENAPPGALMIGSGSGSAGALYGHIGIMVTNRMVISEVGGQKTESIQSFYAWQTATCRGITGAAGWVPVPGVEYAKTQGGGSYSGIDMTLSESKFVEKWGPRIDRFTETYICTPSLYPARTGALHGHGNAIALYARRNGLDPRILVAISCAECGYGNVVTYGGSAGPLNYFSWSSGLWSNTIDGMIQEFCEKLGGPNSTAGINGKGYAGLDMEGFIANGYGGADAENAYIRQHWPPVINGI